MNEKQLKTEVRRLRRIIAAAAKKADAAAKEAKARNALIDKLTAALLHVDVLMKQLRRGR